MAEDKPAETGATSEAQPSANGAAEAHDDPNAQDGPRTLDEAREALREALQALEQSKAEKSAHEERAREVEELRREIEASRRGGTPPTSDPRSAQLEARLQRLGETLADWQLRARNGDRDAELMIAALEEQQNTARDMKAELELARIRDDEVRDGARKVMQRERIHNVDLARKIYLGERYEADRDAIDKAKRELGEDAERKANGKVSTSTVGVSRATVEKDRMTFKQFARQVDNLRAQGKHDEANALVNDIRANPHKVYSGSG